MTKKTCYDVHNENIKPYRKKRKGFFSLLTIGACVLFALCAVCATSILATSTAKKTTPSVAVGGSTRSLPIYSVERTDKKIAISFDCAWGVDYTDKLLSVMEQNDVKCTFFAVQFWVEKYPEYAEKIVDAGHELGTHSRTHSYMSTL